MEYGKERAWAEVSLDAIAYNYLEARRFLGAKCEVVAVLKADAYGHGAAVIGRFLSKLGCKMFAAASVEEAMELRDNGVTGSIMLLCPIPETQFAAAAENGFVFPLTGIAYAEKLSDYAVKSGVEIPTYIMFDCGLTRLGIVVRGREEEAVREAVQIAWLPGLRIRSLMSHLTAGGVPEQDSLNREQLACFDSVCRKCYEKGLMLPRHCCASRLAVRYPEYQHEYARIGSDLFGVHPYYGTGPRFRPAMQLKARIVQIKNVDTGTYVGYGPLYRAERAMIVAVLPIGYVDGLSTRLGSRMQMLVHGKRVFQIGRLCMDFCMIDVTEVPDVKEGDIVTIFGNDGDDFLSVQEHAEKYQGTASELICLLGRRIPRFYTENGVEAERYSVR